MLSKLDDWLVEGWRACWRWFSLQFHAFNIGLLALIQLAPVLPPEIKAVIPQPWAGIVTAIWAALGLYARLIKQKLPGGDG